MPAADYTCERCTECSHCECRCADLDLRARRAEEDRTRCAAGCGDPIEDRLVWWEPPSIEAGLEEGLDLVFHIVETRTPREPRGVYVVTTVVQVWHRRCFVTCMDPMASSYRTWLASQSGQETMLGIDPPPKPPIFFQWDDKRRAALARRSARDAKMRILAETVRDRKDASDAGGASGAP